MQTGKECLPECLPEDNNVRKISINGLSFVQRQKAALRGLTRFCSAENAAFIASLVLYYVLTRTTDWVVRPQFSRQLIDYGHLLYWEKRLGWLILGLGGYRQDLPLFEGPLIAWLPECRGDRCGCRCFNLSIPFSSHQTHNLTKV